MQRIPYVVVDVFTRTRFGGNQLAVITDGRGLSDLQMQQIATEFNFSETTFVLPAANPGNTARVRIFNRSQEMPFAGHPNVGTAFVLGREASVFGVTPGATMRFEELAGLVEVEVSLENGAVRGATITAPRPLHIGITIPPDIVAGCLGLREPEIILSCHAPVQVSVGAQFVVVEVAPDSLPGARPVFDSFLAAAAVEGYRENTGRFAIFLYARTGRDFHQLRARMFSPLSGTFEDAATGSASAALGAYLAALDPQPTGHFDIRIEQGIEMGRPSEIRLHIRKSQGKVERVSVSGDCVPVMRGELEIA